MTAPAWFQLLGLVAVPQGPSTGALAGDFDAAPVVNWEARLPGPPVAVATATELGAPVLHGEHILLGSAGTPGLQVLHREDGRHVHTLTADGPVQAAPTLAGDRVLFADTAGTVWCYRLGTWELLWSKAGSAPVLSSPVVAEVDGVDLVLVSDLANVIVALDMESGALIWRHAQQLDLARGAALELYGAPAPGVMGDLALAGFADGTLVALGMADGAVVWQRRVGEGAYPDVLAAPLALDGAALIGGFSEPLVSLDMETQVVRWRQNVGGAATSLVVGEGANTQVIHGGGDGVLRAFQAVSGAELWTWDSGTASALTSPVATDAGLLVGASAGSLYLVDVHTGEGLWVHDGGHKLSGISAAPAVDGRQAVVVTNVGTVLSFVVP